MISKMSVRYDHGDKPPNRTSKSRRLHGTLGIETMTVGDINKKRDLEIINLDIPGFKRPIKISKLEVLTSEFDTSRSKDWELMKTEFGTNPSEKIGISTFNIFQPCKSSSI